MKKSYQQKRAIGLKSLSKEIDYLREVTRLQADYIRILELYLDTENKTLKRMLQKANPYDREYAEAIL